ncbi:MAG: hypothetical protein QM639_04475 [Rhodocyclaceae bacterium]
MTKPIRQPADWRVIGMGPQDDFFGGTTLRLIQLCVDFLTSQLLGHPTGVLFTFKSAGDGQGIRDTCVQLHDGDACEELRDEFSARALNSATYVHADFHDVPLVFKNLSQRGLRLCKCMLLAAYAAVPHAQGQAMANPKKRIATKRHVVGTGHITNRLLSERSRRRFLYKFDGKFSRRTPCCTYGEEFIGSRNGGDDGLPCFYIDDTNRRLINMAFCRDTSALMGTGFWIHKGLYDEPFIGETVGHSHAPGFTYSKRQAKANDCRQTAIGTGSAKSAPAKMTNDQLIVDRCDLRVHSSVPLFRQAGSASSSVGVFGWHARSTPGSRCSALSAKHAGLRHSKTIPPAVAGDNPSIWSSRCNASQTCRTCALFDNKLRANDDATIGIWRDSALNGARSRRQDIGSIVIEGADPTSLIKRTLSHLVQRVIGHQEIKIAFAGHSCKGKPLGHRYWPVDEFDSFAMHHGGTFKSPMLTTYPMGRNILCPSGQRTAMAFVK